MDVIDRTWVLPNFLLHNANISHNYNDLCDMIDKWKYILCTKYNAQKGMTFGFTISNTDIKYFSLVFACVELGLKIVVYQRPYKIADINNYKIQAFTPIDLMVYDDYVMNDVIKMFISLCSTTSFSINELDEEVLITSIDYPVVHPDDILLLTTSSGTTDTPKIISHSHKFFYLLCKRNCDILNFCESDNILHVRNLHHGSSISVFFFPSLHQCTNHYYINFEDDNIELLTDTISLYSISKLLVPYNILVNSLSNYLINHQIFFPKLTIFNLSYLEKEWISLCQHNHLLSITSIFGCNEVGGPIFLPSMDATTSQSLFNSEQLGPLLDDFYKLEIINGSLHVYVDCYNKWINLEDSFSCNNENYLFHGKNRLIRVNDVEFTILEISNIVSQFTNIDHTVVLDEGKLYLALFEISNCLDDIFNQINVAIREQLSPLLSITKYAILNKLDFIYGIKIDNWKLKKYFRDL